MLALAEKFDRSSCVTTSFLADPNGFGDLAQETTGSVTKSFAFRADDRLSGYQSGSTQVAYYYDALDRLVAKSFNQGGSSFTQSFVHLGLENRVLLAKAGDGTVTTYLDGQGAGEHLAEVKNGVFKGYITDHLGSVVNGDAAGSSHSFGLFGEVNTVPTLSISSNPVNFAFAGYDLDLGSQTYLIGVRGYDPVTGRWLSQDPSGLQASVPIREGDDGANNFANSAGNNQPSSSQELKLELHRSVNLYNYAQGNPLLYTDPDGRRPIGAYLNDPWLGVAQILESTGNSNANTGGYLLNYDLNQQDPHVCPKDPGNHKIKPPPTFKPSDPRRNFWNPPGSVNST